MNEIWIIFHASDDELMIREFGCPCVALTRDVEQIFASMAAKPAVPVRVSPDNSWRVRLILLQIQGIYIEFFSYGKAIRAAGMLDTSSLGLYL